MTKKLLTLILLILPLMTAFAQPAPVKKAAKSMFKITTFNEEGNIHSTGYGVFIGEDGTCLGNWTPFVGAASANVIDAQGRKYEVDALIGASEIYNIAKFKVVTTDNKKNAITPIPLATTSIAQGAECWFAEYAIKNPAIRSFSPSKIETFGNDLPYYIFEQTAAEELTGSPFLNELGELMGLMIPAKKRTDVYCPSALLTNDFAISGLSGNDATLRRSGIRVMLPDDHGQALLALVMNGGNNTPKYLATVNDFIAKFPESYSGYNAKAEYYIANNDIASADACMTECVEKSSEKDEAHYAFARLIYNKVLFAPDSTNTLWDLSKALHETEEAYKANPLPVYTYQKAKTLYAMKDFEKALAEFMTVSKTNMRSGECFYLASLCKKNLNAPEEEVTALLDSTVACYQKPYNTEGASYVLIRAQWLDQIGKTRAAVAGYNEYEEAMKNSLNGNFYYMREQLELKAKLYQQALNDINRAIDLTPGEPLFRAEKSVLLVRVKMVDEALESSRQLTALFPSYPDGWAILGLALYHKGDKKQAFQMFDKAKEMGSEMADGMIEQYKK